MMEVGWGNVTCGVSGFLRFLGLFAVSVYARLELPVWPGLVGLSRCFVLGTLRLAYGNDPLSLRGNPVPVVLYYCKAKGSPFQQSFRQTTHRPNVGTGEGARGPPVKEARLGCNRAREV